MTKILSDSNIQLSIKENLPKVKNSEFELEYNTEDVKAKSNTVDIFGKTTFENPYISEKNSKPQQNVKTIEDGKIVDKISDTKAVLLKSYPERPEPISSGLQHLLSTVEVIREDVIKSNYEAVQKMVKGIKASVVKYGVDLKNIENKIYPAAKLKSFISALESYITNPTAEFAKVYDDFFENNNPITEPSRAETASDILLDTELSEYELFRDHNLIRKDKNLYTKITPLENLFEVFATTQSDITSREQLEAKVPEMEIEDEDFDSEVAENMFMWKSYLKVPIKTESNKQTDNIDISEVVNNLYKKATFKGVELINDDPITAANAELYEKVKPEIENLHFDDSLDKRLAALKDPYSVEKIKTDYTTTEDEVVVTKNNTEGFVRIGDKAYERIYETGNVSFFKEVDSPIKNLSNIDFSKFDLLTTTEEKWVDVKHPTTKELLNINKTNFNCN